jgi:hypothetical protein
LKSRLNYLARAQRIGRNSLSVESRDFLTEHLWFERALTKILHPVLDLAEQFRMIVDRKLTELYSLIWRLSTRI